MCEINSFTYVIYASILFVSVENDVIPFIWPLCVTLQLVSCAEDETLREMIEVAVHRLHDALSPAFWQATVMSQGMLLYLQEMLLYRFPIKMNASFFFMCKINFSWVSQSVSFRPSKPPMAALKRFTLISVMLAYSGYIKHHLQWCSADLLAVASQPQTLTVCNRWTFVDHIWTRGWSARWSAIPQAQIPAN